MRAFIIGLIRQAMVVPAMAALLPLVASGCTDPYGNFQYTGESRIYPILDVPTGDLPPSSVGDFGMPVTAFSEPAEDSGGHSRYYVDRALEDPGKRTLTLRINRVFMKYLADLDPSKEVLAYVEVVDHADPQQKHRRVIFDNEFQVEGAYLNFNNKIVYGPRIFHGRPIEINFYVFELDQKENRVAIEAVQEIKKTVALLGPQVAVPANLIGDIVIGLIGINIDDRELQFNCTLIPSTTLKPDTADQRIRGQLLRTGNYVLVKEERSRLNASLASTISFDDERSFPQWVADEDLRSKFDWKWPNVVYMGGELKVTRAYDKLVRDAQGGPRTSAERLMEFHRQPEGKGVFGAGKKEIKPYYQKSIWNLETPFTSGRATIPDLQDKPGMPAPVESAKLGEQPVSQKTRKDFESFVNANYTNYRSKSYLSFTIQDQLSAMDEAVLTELEKPDSARIAEIVPSLTEEQAKAVIGSMGAAVRVAVVHHIARNRLKSKNSEEDINSEVAALKKRFGDEYEPEIRAEADMRIERLRELAFRTGFDPAKNLAEFKKKLGELLPTLKQISPDLAKFAEVFIRDSVPTTQPSS